MRQALLLLSLFSNYFAAQASQLPLSPAQTATQSKLAHFSTRLPLSFESNHGQVGKAVKFLMRGPGYTVLLAPNEVVLELPASHPNSGGKNVLDRTEPSPFPFPGKAAEAQQAAKSGTNTGMSLSMRLTGPKANTNPAVEGVDELPGKSHYLNSKDRTKWQTGISNYGKVRYRSVYPGIDLVYYGQQQQLEYDFIVQPGADPKDIRMDLSGAQGATISANGDLLLTTPAGELRLQKPLIYQTVKGEKHNVDGRFVLHQVPKKEQAVQVGFQVASYDVTQPLVIDPVLSYASYLEDTISGVAVDSDGNALVTGFTTTPHVNAFIKKISADGATLLYTTYLGDGAGSHIVVDSVGNVLVTGCTESRAFPTINALFPDPHVGIDFFGKEYVADIFVAKLSPDGSQLLYSTYLGGTDVEGLDARIAVDSEDNVIISGITTSGDFPVTANTLDFSYSDGGDAFITKISADGSQLLYSSYFGGIGIDIVSDLAVDGNDNMVICGYSAPQLGKVSNNFPTANALYTQDITRGAFVSKISADGRQLLYSTFLPGVNYCHGIALDHAGNTYLTGSASSNFLATPQALFPNGHFWSDAFLLKISDDGSKLLFATFLGGEGIDSGEDIAVDSQGNAVITGTTSSSDFPTTFNGRFPNPLLDYSYKQQMGDAFVSKISADGSELLYSTYLGGRDRDKGLGIALDSLGNAVVIGETHSFDFPVGAGMVSNPSNSSPYREKGSFWSGFIAAKLDVDNCDSPCLSVRSPIGGEGWNEGVNRTLRWASKGIDPAEKLSVYISKDSGLTWKKLFKVKNTGDKTWKIPRKRFATQQGLIKICLEKKGLQLCDQSDAAFAINRAPVAKGGKMQTVTWGSMVTLDASASYDPDNAPNTMTYSWHGDNVFSESPLMTFSTADLLADLLESGTLDNPNKSITMTYWLSVSDGAASSKSVPVKVKIKPAPK